MDPPEEDGGAGLSSTSSRSLTGHRVLSPARERVFRALASGLCSAAVADSLKISRQAVSQHLRALVRAGLIVLDKPASGLQSHALGGNVKVYKPTTQGLELWQVSSGLSSNHHGGVGGLTTPRLDPVEHPRADAASTEPRVRVHNFRIKMAWQGSPPWLPSEAQMRGWLRRWDRNFHGAYLEMTPKHLILAVAGEGATRAQAEGEVYAKLLRLQHLIVGAYGLTLGLPTIQAYGPGKAKIGVVGHPLGEGVPSHEGEAAAVDRTPERGTIHPRDPADADRIVSIGRNAAETRELVEEMARLQVRLSEAVLAALGGGGPRPPASPRDAGEIGPEVA